MNGCYNLDGIKTELKKRIDETQCFLKAWNAVTFPTKKDGTPFVTMSKNISGAKYGAEQYALQPGENKLTVYTRTELSGYKNDTIDCYNLVKYLSDETQKAKTQNYMPKQTYLEQVYCFDIDDIKQAVADRIGYLKKQLQRQQTELQNAEQVFFSFRDAYAIAIEKLACDTGKTDLHYSDLFYFVKDTIIERFPYC